MPIDTDEALRKVNEYLSQVELLLTRSYTEEKDQPRGLWIRIKNFVRITFPDANEKLKDFRFPMEVGVGRREPREEERQERYVSILKILRNHLLAYKEELELIAASGEKLGKIDKIERETREIRAEAERRTAVVDEKRWGAVIELLTIQREELKRRDETTKQIIELRKEIRDLKSMVSMLRESLERKSLQK